MSELNLLIECINTEGEAEDGGIKYIYMDADTIYRFENNRMKKISKTLINKARKQIQSQNTIRQLNQVQDDVAENSPPPKNPKKSKSIFLMEKILANGLYLVKSNGEYKNEKTFKLIDGYCGFASLRMRNSINTFSF